MTEADLSAVVQWFQVSPPIAAIALSSRSLIDNETKQSWMSLSTPYLATRFGWSDQYQSLQNDANRTRSPQRLLTRAIAGYAEGVISAQTIATLRGISTEAVVEELTEAGVTPRLVGDPWISADDLPTVSVDLSDLEDSDPTSSAV